MSEFEFIFALFGLLLGLSIAEVLGGLARAIEAHLNPKTHVRIGWLTPLLGAFVLLDLLSFWQAAWVVRDLVAVSSHALMAVTAFASAYYLAAHLVFPREAANEPDFDNHFFRIRRVVLGVMFALLLCQVAWYASVPQLSVYLTHTLSLTLTIVLAVLMLAAMIAPGRIWATIVMIALVARYVVLYLL